MSNWERASRNDLCSCGSGRKYKHCHMAQDRQAAAQTPASPRTGDNEGPAPDEVNNGTPSPPDARAEPERDADVQRFNKLFKAFDGAEYEGKIEICRYAIRAGEMDGELALEFFATLYEACAERDERHRFAELADLLAEEQPAVYREQASWFLDWQINNALFAENWNAVDELLERWAEPAGADLEVFYRTLDGLAYAGRMESLLRALETGWLGLRDNEREYFDSALDVYRVRQAETIILDHMLRHPDARQPDAALRAALSGFSDLNDEWVEEQISRWHDWDRSRWSQEDFRPSPPGHGGRPQADEEDELPDAWQGNLARLINEFVVYLIQQENIPPTRALLVRDPLYEYFVDRHAGDRSGDRDESLAGRGSRRRKRRRSRSRTRNGEARSTPHPLLPDPATLDRHLGRYFGFLSINPTPAGALFEMLPTWLRFLESRELLEAEEREQALQNLSGLRQNLIAVFAGNVDYPGFAARPKEWP